MLSTAVSGMLLIRIFRSVCAIHIQAKTVGDYSNVEIKTRIESSCFECGIKPSLTYSSDFITLLQTSLVYDKN